MSDLADTVNDAVERAGEPTPLDRSGGGRFSLNTLVALSAAITATFIAVCNVKDGNIVQAMQQAQAGSIDAWATYQAKGTKLNIAESALDSLRLQAQLAPPATPEARALVTRTISEYEEKLRHYEKEKADIKVAAEGFGRQYDSLNVHDDQFDMAEAATSIAIALFAMTALTQKRRLIFVALTFALVGIILGTAGFLGLGLHPNAFARLLG
jgi:predicted nuclease with RNAse H fold